MESQEHPTIRSKGNDGHFTEMNIGVRFRQVVAIYR